MRRSTRSRRGIVAAASLAAALALATVHSASAVAADAFPAGGVMPEGWIVAPDVAAGWAVASGPAFEGTFSLKSEPIENGQRAGIEVSGTFAAGTLSFARRVSSEAGFDFLRFYIDGVFQQEWSGDAGWAVAAYGVTAGTHTFRWEYEKDDAVAAGADAAWIDAVMLPPASTTPTFAFAATGYTIDEGAGPVVIAVKRSGSTRSAASVRYATANGTALAGADYAAATGTLDFAAGESSRTITLQVTDDTASEAREAFTVTLSNPSSGAVLGSPSGVTVTVIDDDDTFPVGGVIPAGWVTPQTAGWIVAGDVAHEGSQSLKSSAIGDGRTTAIEVSGTFAAGTVTFARKVSSEPDFDHLRFYVDGALAQQWSGEMDWDVASFPVGAGRHAFRWEYAKDESVAVGSDAAWIDAVVLPPPGGAAPRLASAASRKVHGAAGAFDLPLASTPASPTTEVRTGPAHTIVFTFDKPVVAGSAAVTEGTASVATPTFGANEMRVPLTGVADTQYVTVSVGSVIAADGGAGGVGSVRIGFLVGDATQNGTVTVSDLAQVNAAIVQPVTATNFLKDLNASGTLTVADKGIANTRITKALPAP